MGGTVESQRKPKVIPKKTAITGLGGKNMNIAIILISHNIGVIAETSNKIAVMKNGSILEKGSTFDVLTKPQDNYTKHLLSCIPPWLEV